MSKAYSNLSEIIFGDLFIRQDNTYNFRTNREFQIPTVNTFWNGSNSISILDQSSEIWFLHNLNIQAHYKIPRVNSKMETKEMSLQNLKNFYSKRAFAG